MQIHKGGVLGGGGGVNLLVASGGDLNKQSKRWV